RRALDNEEFCLHYQPKINMLSGEVTGVEALIRWQHPEKGLLLPGAFLPLVKGTELEISIGIWVMNEAARQISEWEARGWQVEVSINVSPYHLQSSGFCANLGRAINSHSIKSDSCIQLEILESSELGDIDNICDVIKTCQETMGVHIALDDFGTGYSALTHIRNLSADVVKIDRSFVNGLLDNPGDFEIIKGVISLCEAFDCGVIAEGVETIEQGQILLLLGCQHAQGYCIARPQAAEEMFCWIQNYQPKPGWQEFSRLELAVEEKEQFFLETVLACNLESIKDKFQTNNSTPQLDYSDYYQQSHYLSWKQRNKNKLMFASKWLDELDSRYDAVCDNLVNLEKLADSRHCTNQDLTQAIEHTEQAFDLMRAHLKAQTFDKQLEQAKL
ncbi:MAG: EAL domain-containing protein, partial [Gammaproteobacteria bacterium]|nr:EAL domain-containing protein [Gammaproteobacteria bacterium]